MVTETYPRTAIKRTSVLLTASGELVAAVAGRRIQVLAMHVHCNAAADATATIQDDSDTLLSVTMSVDRSAGPQVITLPYNKRGWLQTGSVLALDAVLGGTSPTIGFTIVYTEI